MYLSHCSTTVKICYYQIRHCVQAAELCYYRRNIMLFFRTYRVTPPDSSKDKNRRTALWTRRTHLCHATRSVFKLNDSSLEMVVQNGSYLAWLSAYMYKRFKWETGLLASKRIHMFLSALVVTHFFRFVPTCNWKDRKSTLSLARPAIATYYFRNASQSCCSCAVSPLVGPPKGKCSSAMLVRN